MIAYKHDYRVQLKFKAGLYNSEARLQQLNEIRAWLDELTEWQPDMYSLRFHSSGTIIDIWFLEENHAIMCALKWV